MGDRATIAFQHEKDSKPIYFYAHWAGHDIARAIKDALEVKERWDDPSYLARIVFCQLVTKERWDSTTGIGIDLEPAGDLEHNILLVNVSRQSVEEHPRSGITLKPLRSWSFQEFIDKGAEQFQEEEL